MEKLETTEILLDNKQYRDQYISRVEILDKVKSLMLIPTMDCMTIKQVADYYEVEQDTIKKVLLHNSDEFISDGVTCKSPIDWQKQLKGQDFPLVKTQTKLIVQIDDNTTLEIPNRGIRVFPKRAILRMGMLLRDSVIAKEVRTQLLNVVGKVEETNPKILSEAIDEEMVLQNNAGAALMSGDIMEFGKAMTMIVAYKNRHITALQNENVSLVKTNKILSAEILTWNDRNQINALMRKLSGKLCISYGMAWGILYKQLLYKFNINVKARGDKKKPYIKHIKENEWKYVQQSIAAILESNNIDVSEFFSKSIKTKQ